MAFVALSPIRNAHWVISGEMPILANTGTKMKDIKAHLAVADTIKRLTSAVKRMKRINIHKLLKEAEDSRLAPKMAMHLSKWESVSYTHLRAHETGRNLVCRLLLEKKKKTRRQQTE